MVSGIFWCNWALLLDSHLAPSESMLLAVLGVAPKDRPRHRNRESGDEDQEPDGVRQELLGRVDRDGMAGVKRSSLSATGPRGSHVSPECSTRKGLFEYATARTMIAELWSWQQSRFAKPVRHTAALRQICSWKSKLGSSRHTCLVKSTEMKRQLIPLIWIGFICAQHPWELRQAVAVLTAFYGKNLLFRTNLP